MQFLVVFSNHFRFSVPEGVTCQGMAKVIVRENESIKDALRRFKKICEREGIVNRSKRSSRYEKPSERRRRERNERLKNIRKAQKSQG
jgi:small subunit ribosomal protein S21